jgi:hypothetical protein
MTAKPLPDLMAALRAINGARGYGDIAGIRRYLSGRIELTISRPYMRDSQRIARVEIRDGACVLYYCGTSRRVRDAGI